MRRNREEESSLLSSLFVFLSRITSISASWRGSGASDECGAVRSGAERCEGGRISFQHHTSATWHQGEG